MWFSGLLVILVVRFVIRDMFSILVFVVWVVMVLCIVDMLIRLVFSVCNIWIFVGVL